MHEERIGAAGTAGDLSRGALRYLSGVMVAATAAATPALLALEADARDFATFVLLAGAAIAGQLLVVETGKNHGFPTAIAFLVAGVLLLPPGLVVLLVLAQHAPDAVLRRYPWYIQGFNVGNYTLNALAASAAVAALSAVGTPAGNLEWAAAALTASIAFVTLNHLLLAVMLRLGRGHGVRESGLFSAESLSIDLVMAIVGIGLAALSTSNAALIVVAVAPLLIADRLFRLMASTSTH